MPVETAADRAAFLNSEEFGATGTYARPGGAAADIVGIFDAPWLRIDGVAEVPITSASPMFICASVDLPAGAAQGDAFTVDGVAYRVRELRPDGTGLTTLDLDKA